MSFTIPFPVGYPLLPFAVLVEQILNVTAAELIKQPRKRASDSDSGSDRFQEQTGGHTGRGWDHCAGDGGVFIFGEQVFDSLLAIPCLRSGALRKGAALWSDARNNGKHSSLGISCAGAQRSTHRVAA